jgi:hypothetical protein
MTVGNLDAKLNLLASNMSLLQAPIPIAEDVLKAPFDEITAFLTFESEIKASKDMADLLVCKCAFTHYNIHNAFKRLRFCTNIGIFRN